MTTRVVNVSKAKGGYGGPYDVYIGRNVQGGYKKSIWHNPFVVGSSDAPTVEDAVWKYYEYMMSPKCEALRTHLPELKGKVLGCWCKKGHDELCHGDVLVYLVDGTMTYNLRALFEKRLNPVKTVTLKESPLLEDRVRGGVLGLILGDSLGVPHEFKYSKFPYTGVLQHRFKLLRQFQQPVEFGVGQYSDDSEMMLALARSLTENKKYIPQRVVESYLRWAASGQHAMGRNTRELLKGSGKGKPLTYKGYTDRFAKGHGVDAHQPFTASTPEAQAKQSNGALMRCLPLACLGQGEDLDLTAVAADVWCTNPSTVSYWAEYLYLMGVRMAFLGKPAVEIWTRIVELKEGAPEEVKRVFDYIASNTAWPMEFEGEKKVKGWVLTAFYCAMRVLAAIVVDPKLSYAYLVAYVIQLGGDTDTNGAVAGGLIGALVGYDVMASDKTTYDNMGIMITSTQPGSVTDNPRPAEFQIGDIINLCHELTELPKHG